MVKGKVQQESLTERAVYIQSADVVPQTSVRNSYWEVSKPDEKV